MNKLFTVYVLFIVWGGASADITFEPTSIPGDVSIDTVEVEGITYHTVSVADFPLPMTGECSAGLPSVPFTAQTFLLPPDIAIDTILITSASWDTLPGRYYLYPAQSGSMEDTTFALPDTEVYSSEDPFPSQPVMITRQGTAMGYSVASFSGTPVRYIPKDSLLMVLTSVSLNIQTCDSEFERKVPVRETEWSASVRERGILSLVANHSAIRFYQRPAILSYGDRTTPLNILDSPSLEGDGVDMVIITSGPNGSGPDLTSAFQNLADYRTAQGIITIIRTVDWIDNLYSGCDIQEKIRNFIKDAHEQWGVQAVLLGGDDWIVPVRECEITYYPSDDYYADLDGNWVYNGPGKFNWRAPETDYYVDLILGRWPVDKSDDVDLLLSKLKLYEWPEVFPDEFARKALFIGGSSSGTNGKGAAYLDYIICLLDDAGIFSEPGSNLDMITELYYPQSGTAPNYWTLLPDNYFYSSEEQLSRITSLTELNQGYNLIIHMDHSGTHLIGAAQQAGEYIYEYDFQSLTNSGEPSILWTAGCWPGHFEGADCFAEAGLLTSDETGLVAVIANSRSGYWGDWRLYYPFMDALYPFGWIDDPISGPPYPIDRTASNIGEALRYSKNFENSDYLYGQPYNPVESNSHWSIQHLFGDPTMFVWRDDPHQLAVEAVPSVISAGTSTDITVSVTDSDALNQPLAAKVCLYKDGDLFAIRYTDAVYGTVTFHDVEVAHTGQITVTAIKRRSDLSMEPGVCNFIPGEDQINVIGSPSALVNLEDFILDDDNTGQSEGNGDGVANPGETIELDLVVENLGMTAATHLRAQLSLVSGDVLIEDDFEGIGYLAGGANVKVDDAFVVSIPEDLDGNEPVQMEVSFNYDQGSWESPCDFTVLVDDIELPLHSVDVEYDDEADITTVEVTNILAVNTGIGSAEDVEITLDNFSHGAVFSTDVSVVGDIVPGTSAEIPSLFVECDDPPEEWKDPYNSSVLPGCTFAIIATDTYDREIYSEVINVPDYDPEFRPIDPEHLESVEAGQDYINVEWIIMCDDFEGGYYLYQKEDGTLTWNRSNLLPIPVEQYTYSGLESATVYELAVSAVDEYGQESSLCLMENAASTVCTVVDGWPIQLQGNPGSGPVSVNMDEDDDEEVVAVSSFGYVYIIDRDGSMETIPPPVSLDYDRYVSCAVGDVDNDLEEEIVVSYQVDISNGTAGVLIYDKDASGNWDIMVVDDNIGPGETVCAAEISGTPVLLQANDSSTLEIALRTKGTNSLYLWEWDAISESWVVSSGFPIDLHTFFTPPVAVDYDGDGYDELFVTDLIGSESKIHVVDFTSTSSTEYEIDLSCYLDDDHPAAVFSSLAVVKWNDDFYLIGVARQNDPLPENWDDYTYKKVFVYNLTENHMEWWHHDWQTGYDCWANMGGPAIGQIDADAEPEVTYTLVGMCGWDLVSHEYPEPVWPENAGVMEENPHGDWDETVRSATIIGGTTIQGSDVQIPFTGFSTLNYGHDPQDEMNVLPGFPTWSEDACFVAPLIIDLDVDGQMECLTSDASGLLTLYEWEGYSTSSEGWPMYQHDPWRTGYYNKQFTDGGKLDFDLVGIEEASLGIRRDADASRTLIAEVEVTGSGISAPVVADVRASSVPITSTPRAVRIDNNPSAERTDEVEVQQVRQPLAVIIENDYDIVKIALFSGNRELDSSEFPLYDGTHLIELAVPSGEEFKYDDFVVRVDPGNEYVEATEDNNSRAAGNLAINAPFAIRVYLQNPCESIVLNIDLMEAVSGGMSIKAYSIDGRLVAEEELTELDSGSFIIELLTPGILPAGLYTVVIKGINEEELIRRVVVLP